MPRNDEAMSYVASGRSKLKTQNSKLKTQNSKLKTQNIQCALTKAARGEPGVMLLLL